MYGVAQTRTRLLGRRTLNPQAAKQVLSECAILTSRQNLVQIPYLSLNRMYPVAHARAPDLDFPPKIVQTLQPLEATGSAGLTNSLPLSEEAMTVRR